MRLIQSGQSSTSVAATSFMATLPVACVSGSTLIAIIATSAGAATGNITSITGGGSWTELGESGVSGVNNTHLSVWMLNSATPVSSVTINNSNSVTWQVQLLEVYGNTVLDQPLLIAQPSANTTVHTTATLTPLTDQSFLIAAVAAGGTGTVTPLTPSQFIALPDPPTSGNIHNRSGYWDRGGILPYSATWTSSTSTRSTSAIFALRQKRWQLVPPYVEEELLIRPPGLRYRQRQGVTAYGNAAPLTVKRDPSNNDLSGVTHVFRGGRLNETDNPAVRQLWLDSGFSVTEV